MGGKTSGSVIRKLSVRRSRAGPELDQRARGTAAAAWRTRQAAQVRSVSLREKLTSGEPGFARILSGFRKRRGVLSRDIRELFTTRGAALSRRPRFRSPAVSGASGAEAGSFACGFGNGRSREKSLRSAGGKGIQGIPFPGEGERRQGSAQVTPACVFPAGRTNGRERLQGRRLFLTQMALASGEARKSRKAFTSGSFSCPLTTPATRNRGS